MANRPSFTLKIHRRDFLTSTVALTTCRPFGNVDPKDVARGELFPIAGTDPTIPSSCVVTRVRIAEIARRNDLRQEVGLPLLSIPKELRRLKSLETAERFTTFSNALRARVRDKAIARIRRQRGEPNWKPSGMLAGMGFEYEVIRDLRRLYERIG